jgi:hypothetical protein
LDLSPSYYYDYYIRLVFTVQNYVQYSYDWKLSPSVHILYTLV